MAIVPSGKRRLMVAQAAPDPMTEQAGDIDTTGVQPGDQFTDPALTKPLEDPAGEMQQEVDEAEVEMQESGGEGDIRQTVFEFLVDLGYPPRRLYEFKSQFISEQGSPDRGTEITVKIPDEVYGKNMPIPRDKMKILVQAIEQTHGMSFQQYRRQNEELIFEFLSADAARAQSMEDAGPGDILDKVYGGPGKQQRSAQTINEMIKESKNRQVDMLRRVLGDKK